MNINQMVEALTSLPLKPKGNSMKTSELTGTALDYAVAVANGTDHLFDGHEVGRLHYSTDWPQGGPIIEREHINLWSTASAHFPQEPKTWEAEKRHFGKHHKAGRNYASGPTALIAAMRCFVASKLGDEVEIPEELR